MQVQELQQLGLASNGQLPLKKSSCRPVSATAGIVLFVLTCSIILRQGVLLVQIKIPFAYENSTETTTYVGLALSHSLECWVSHLAIQATLWK